MALLEDTGTIHIIGIAGSGMSAIAQLLLHRGHQVQGSDVLNGKFKDSFLRPLQSMPIKIFMGQKAENLGDARTVICSPAITDTNPELAAAKEKSLRILDRAEVLVELLKPYRTISISGSHGKSSSTSITGELLEAGGLDPTVVVGAIVNNYDNNVHIGKGEWMVFEADESDALMTKVPAEIVIVTNINNEHVEYRYNGNFDELRKAFQQYVEMIPPHGLAVLCIDHPEVKAIADRVTNRRIIRYGRDEAADFRLSNVRFEGRNTIFDVEMQSGKKKGTLKDLVFPIPGQHFASNAVASIAVAVELGVSEEHIRQTLSKWGGVARRFVCKDTWNGISIYDDFAHHPEEVKATLKAAREICKDGRLIALHQPFSSLRLQYLFDEFIACFDDADTVIIAQEYVRTKLEDESINGEALVERIKARGIDDVRYMASPNELAAIVGGVGKPGDLVILTGSGDNNAWAESLAGELEALSKQE